MAKQTKAATPSYEDLTALRDRLQRDIDRAEGVRDKAVQRLKTEYECETLGAAKKLLAKYEAEEQKAEQDYADAVAAFAEEWADELDAMEGRG